VWAGCRVIEVGATYGTLNRLQKISKILSGMAAERQIVLRCSVSALSEGEWTNQKSQLIPVVKVVSTFTLTIFSPGDKSQNDNVMLFVQK
jgi:hypothetical protein